MRYVGSFACNQCKPFLGRFFFLDGSDGDEVGGGVTAGEYVATPDGTARELEAGVELEGATPPQDGAEALPIFLRN